MAIHSSILAWKIPWAKEPDGLQPMGSQRVRHNCARTRYAMELFQVFLLIQNLHFTWRMLYTMAMWTWVKCPFHIPHAYQEFIVLLSVLIRN